MNNLKRVEILSFGVGILLLLICVLFSNRSLDINVHDTYFVIAPKHVGVLFLIVYVFYGVVYTIIHRYQKRYLGYLHLALTTPFLFSLVLSTIYIGAGLLNLYHIGAILSLLFLLGNIIFLTNILFSIAMAIKQNSQS